MLLVTVPAVEEEGACFFLHRRLTPPPVSGH